MTEVADNLAELQQKISKTADKWQRDASEISLMAVSKKQPLDRVKAALDAGHRLFGENRVQEANEKWPAFREKYDGIELHLIGPLQTNKAKEAVALFDVIQSVDRPKLARILAKEMKAANKDLPLYIQINIGEEDQKSGISIEEADSFIQECREELGLNIIGLMCIPPNVEQVAPYFALLARIAKRNGLEKLSMGMSGDYETAIQFGATSVRVGTGVFGSRAS